MPIESRTGPLHFNAPTTNAYRTGYDRIFGKKTPATTGIVSIEPSTPVKASRSKPAKVAETKVSKKVSKSDNTKA